MTEMTPWQNAQVHEARYWENPAVFDGEAVKQQIHARLMGLPDFGKVEDDGRGYPRQLAGKRILDIGGGCMSITMRYPSLGQRVVVDPLEPPAWAHNITTHFDCEIEFVREKAEDYLDDVRRGQFDEVWMYNCLQHVEDPQAIADGLANAAPVVRVFEWCNIPTDECHLHVITPALFRRYTPPRQFWNRHQWFEGRLTDQLSDASCIAFHVSCTS